MGVKIPGKSEPVEPNQLIDGVKNFTWGEATKGLTRIPVTWKVTANIIKVAKVLQELRNTKFERRPVHINSWYRPPYINQQVGGARNSKHLEGHAVDFRVDGLSAREVQRLLADFDGGLGSYSNFTHLDLGAKRRWNG